MNAPARVPLPVIQGDVIEQLSYGKLPELERQLVMLARGGQLKGVVKKKPRYSASTIENYSQCARKYYWQTLPGLEEPTSTAQAFGTKLHFYEEKWLKEGIPPPRHDAQGQLANLGLALLPTPKAEGLHVEHSFAIKLPGVPVEVTGQMDFTRDPVDAAGASFLLGDHKTAGSRYFWQKEKGGDAGKEWLKANIQSNLYSWVRYLQLKAKGFDKIKVVDKQWIYYFKDEKSVEKLRVVQDIGDVAERYDTTIRPLIVGMAAMVKDAPKIADIPAANEEVCGRYNGCAHLARCFGFGLKPHTMGGASARFSKASVLAQTQAPDGAATKEHGIGVMAGKFSKAGIQAKAAASVAPKAQTFSAPKTGAGAEINPPKPVPLKAVPTIEEDVNTDLPDELNVASDEETEQVIAKGKKTIAAAAKQLDKALAPKKFKSDAASTKAGSNSAHSFWLFAGCQPAKGFDSEATPIEDVIAQALADYMEVNPLVGSFTIQPGTAGVLVELLSTHATAVVSGQ